MSLQIQTFRTWVTSDAWEPVSGSITATWMTWARDVLFTQTHNFAFSALDSAQVSEQVGWDAILHRNTSAKDVVLLLNPTARLLKSGTTYMDENFWIPLYSNNATLVDPGLEGDGDSGCGAYVWLTEPAGVVGFFDNNVAFLGKRLRGVYLTLRCNSTPRMRTGFGM